jgi:hypothetical protein
VRKIKWLILGIAVLVLGSRLLYEDRFSFLHRGIVEGYSSPPNVMNSDGTRYLSLNMYNGAMGFSSPNNYLVLHDGKNGRPLAAVAYGSFPIEIVSFDDQLIVLEVFIARSQRAANVYEWTLGNDRRKGNSKIGKYKIEYIFVDNTQENSQ